MPTLSLVIPIVPTPQRRARATVIGGHARMYTDAKQRRDQDSLIAAIRSQLPNDWKPISGPVRMVVIVFFPVPTSYGKAKTLKCHEGLIRHIHKPDLSNIQKHIEDCFNGVVWVDDRQLWDCRFVKKYGDLPGYSVAIEWEE